MNREMLYKEMTEAQRADEYELLRAKLDDYKRMKLKLDMSRGKPSAEQLVTGNAGGYQQSGGLFYRRRI